jgi:hypothetical protein
LTVDVVFLERETKRFIRAIARSRRDGESGSS